MKSLIAIVALSAGLVGCATPQQNAALAGAVVGAAVMTSIHNSQHQPPTRVVTCTYVRGGYVGRDAYGQPMFRYHKVCN